MAKASEAKVPVSARISADLAEQLDALVERTGRSKTVVIEDLIRLGLDAQKGRGEQSSGASADALARVLSAIEDLSGRLHSTPPADEDAPTLADLGEELTEQNGKLVGELDEVKGQLTSLTRGVRRTLAAFLKEARPNLSQAEVKELVLRAFEGEASRHAVD